MSPLPSWWAAVKRRFAMQKPQTSNPRPIRFGALSKPERGKLYFFSPSEGILVVRPWPVLKAWRKTPKRSFKQIRADISLADPPSVLPASRRSEPPSGPPAPNPSEEELQALIAEWPVNSIDDIAQPRMIRGFPFAKRWHVENALRHQQVCRCKRRSKSAAGGARKVRHLPGRRERFLSFEVKSGELAAR